MSNTGVGSEATPSSARILQPCGAVPRVLLVTDSLEPSGVGEHMVTLAAALRQAADVALVFADAPGALPWAERARAAGLPVSVVPGGDLVEGSRELDRLLARQQPDIVHLHAGIGWEGHGLAAAARRFGGRGMAVVRTEHLPYVLNLLKAPHLETLYARSVQSVDRIICVSEAARRTFRMAGVDAARFVVVRNGIEPKLPVRDREQVRAELGIGRAPLVLTVARFTDQKRHATLLQALPALLAVRPDLHLAWVGVGPLEAELRARAVALGVAGRVLFLGRRGDVPDLLAAADLFCLPSIFEGHPLVVLEAMAAGLPVVVTRSLGMTEAVRDGVTGLVVPVGQAPVLASAMIRVLSDAALAARLGAAGRVAVRSEFSAERMARETLAVYRAALDRPGERPPPFLGHPRLVAEIEQIQRKAQECFAIRVPFSSRRRRIPACPLPAASGDDSIPAD